MTTGYGVAKIDSRRSGALHRYRNTFFVNNLSQAECVQKQRHDFSLKKPNFETSFQVRQEFNESVVIILETF